MTHAMMWSIILAFGTIQQALGNTSTRDYKSFDEYLDYYEYDLDIDENEELLAEIDDKIEAKEESYDRYRRQILVERLGLEPGLEIPSVEFTEEYLCPEECTCQAAKVHCTSKFLTEIPTGIPRGVEKLNLGFNRIVDIPSRSFDNFRSTLGFLFLQSNEIRSLGNGLFSKMHEISVLRLSWNKLSGIRKSSLHGLDKIERLYLDNNRLTFIHPLAFRGFENLVFLQLDGNRLSRLHHNVFVTLEFQKFFRHSSIEYLYLANNEFRNLPRHIFDHMTALRLVHLHGNQWVCSCEMKWLKKWIDYEEKYKCKRNSLNPNGREECAVCASPSTLRGKKVQDIPQHNFKCQSPDIIWGTVSDFNPDSLEEENELALFRLSGFYSTRMNLRLDSYRRSMIHASCNLTMIPTVQVANDGRDAKTFAKSYLASFEGNFRCHPEYPTKSSELLELLQPYIGREMNFVQRITRRNAANNAKSYLISVNRSREPSVTPLTRGSISSTSKFLLSDSLTITIDLGSEELERSDGFNIQLRTSFKYTHGPHEMKYSKHPWLLIRQPEPSTVEVALALERKTAAYRCKAVGQPKPKITWILPSGEALRSGESTVRYFVSRSGRIVIRKAVKDDSGYFKCLATIPDTGNATGFPSAAAAEISTLKIDVFPRAQGSFSFFNSGGLRLEHVEQGESWSSICNFEGLPNATTGWIVPSEQLLTGESESSDRRTNVDENGTITVANFSESDQGMYRCVAANPSGRAEYSVFVSIPSNEDELIETIEQPEMEVSDITISTMVFPPNFDSDPLPGRDNQTKNSEPLGKETEVKPTGSRVQVASPSPNITISISSPNSPIMPPVSPINSPKPEEDKDSSNKYLNFTSTPTSFEKHSVVAAPHDRTHRPGAFSPTPTSLARTRKPSKESKNQDINPPSPEKNTLGKKEIEFPLKPPNLFPSHPRGPPAANDHERFAPAYVNRTVITTDDLLQPSTFDVTRTTSSTASRSKSLIRTRQRTIARQRPYISSRFRERIRGSANRAMRPVYSPSRRIQRIRTVPARRIGGGDVFVVPAGRISETVSTTVPARRVQEPRTVRLPGRVIRTHAGNRISIPCAQILRNSPPTFWTFRWSLPTGEVYERPGMFSSPDLTKFVIVNGSLVFTSLTGRDSGQYSCVATERRGIVEYHSIVTLFVRSSRLQIADGERRSIRLQVGDSIAVDCSATGYPKPRVFWRTPKGAIIPQMSTRGRNEVFRNGTLYIHMIKANDYGAYLCIATNGEETRTRTLIIQVANQPPIQPTRRWKEPLQRTQPTQTKRISRTTVQIPVFQSSVTSLRYDVSTTTPPLPSSGDSGPSMESSEDRPASSPATTSLTLTTFSTTTKMASPDGVTIPLESSEDTPTSSSTTTSSTLATTSAIAKMTSPVVDEVTIPEDIFVDLEETTAEVYPTSEATDSTLVVQEEGYVGYGVEDGRINFHCIEEDVDSTSDGWSFAWTISSGEVFERPGSYVSRDWSKFVHRNGSLSLHYLKLDDNGNYTCVANDTTHGVEHHREVQLIVRPNPRRPQISNPLRENVSARAGDSPSLTCDATGEPSPTIIWTTPWGAKLMTGSTNRRATVLQNGTLRISDVRSLEQGSYTCVARNALGDAVRTVVLRVSKRPPRFLGSPRVTIRGKVGERVLLSCASTGHPPPRRYWLLPTGGRISVNQAVFSNVWRNSPSISRRSRRVREAKYRVTTDGTLVINQTTESDMGRYHCVISNNVGTAASTINLFVSR